MTYPYITTISVAVPDEDDTVTSDTLTPLARLVDAYTPVRGLADDTGAGTAYWVGHLDEPNRLSITASAAYDAFAGVDWSLLSLAVEKAAHDAALIVETERPGVGGHTVRGEVGWIGGRRAWDLNSPEPEPLDHLRRLVPDASGHARAVRETVQAAADALLEVHHATGIDLTCWQPVLDVVLLAYPRAVLSGTGPDSEHVIHTSTETGFYSLAGEREDAAQLEADARADADAIGASRHVHTEDEVLRQERRGML